MILFNDFSQEYKLIKDEIDNSISKVLKRGWFILGEELNKFEENFAKKLDAKYSIGVASGTDAITISLMALDIGYGDEVITTNITAYPTISAIIRCGAKPVVVDIQENDGLINFKRIKEKINKKTKAIIPVHLYGQCCDMDSITNIAKNANVYIIEDCAQSFGSIYKGKQSGTLGAMGAFSFYPTKNLGAYGDAGAIITNSRSHYEKILMIRNYGQTKKFIHQIDGFNSRMDEIQAAILNVKLNYIDVWNTKRRKIAKLYDENLINAHPLKARSYNKHSYHLYVIKSQNRKKLYNHLKKNSIQSMIHYPIPVNKQKAFNFQKNESFPSSKKFVNQILSIPIHPLLKLNEVNKIVDCINECS